jgi:DNA-binding beta-propeller fold protein YncE
VADSGNGRIMKWTTNYATGGICVVGCTGTRGVATNQLRSPRDLKFDRDGNLYVSDQGNHRIQKFMINPWPSSGCPSSKYRSSNAVVIIANLNALHFFLQVVNNHEQARQQC